ncbi:MAG: hypothetical protein IJC88_04855 [Oscillospiraceae bacterium]|nr:hypothetical protein [Oscillospiraceae bacterium]
MYPKWLTKLDLLWYGQNYLMQPIFVWRSKKRLSPHTKATYRVFGVAELHVEEFHALSMKFLREFATSFDVVMTVRHKSLLDTVKMNPFLKRPKPECAMIVDEKNIAVLTRSAHQEVLNRLGRDVKAWKKNQWVWDGMKVEFFSPGDLPDDPNEALAWWNEHRPQPAFELKIEFREFSSHGKHYIRNATTFCISAALPQGSTDADEQAFEKWLASVFAELDLDAEWYVTGTEPDCTELFFGWGKIG